MWPISLETFKNRSLRFYLFSFLAFCVLSSKHVFIYNEETLVAASFFLFVVFTIKYFGATISGSLDERSALIQQELENFLQVKQAAFGHVYREHEKVAGLVPHLKQLADFTQGELASLRNLGDLALNQTFIRGVEQRLKTLKQSKASLQQKLQTRLADNVLSDVLVEFGTLKNQPGRLADFQNQTLTQAISVLVDQKGGLNA